MEDLNESIASPTLSEVEEILKNVNEPTPESPSKRGEVLINQLKLDRIKLVVIIGKFNDAVDINIHAPSSFGLDGNKFSRKEKPKFNMKTGEWITYYNCALRRSTNCKAHGKISVKVDNDGKLINKEFVYPEADFPHTCRNIVATDCKMDIIDVRESMKSLMENLISADPTTGAIEMSHQVLTQICEVKYKGQPTIFLTIDQLQRLYYRIKQKMYENWDSIINTPPLCFNADDDPRLFVAFQYNMNIEGQMQRIMGWGNSDLIFLLKSGEKNMFFDATFSCTPKGFYQCLILMIYEPATKLYLPVMYILMQSKKYLAYYFALHGIIVASEWTATARSITFDFETGFQQAVVEQFGKRSDGTKTSIIACSFHLKQALRRFLLKQSIPQESITLLLGPEGHFNLLTVVDPNEIDKAIAFVRFKMSEGLLKPRFDLFWKYFKRTWIDGYGHHQWNIYSILQREDKDDIMINRTNNPIERYNRTLKDNFPHPHPSMTDFVRVIRQQGQHYWQLYEDVRKKRVKSPIHAPPTVTDIPQEYYSFVYQPIH